MKDALARLVALGAVAALVAATAVGGRARGQEREAATPPVPVTVIALRHAEKAAGEGVDRRDPPLSEVGEARARRLAELLAGAEVTHLFSSPYARTRDTLAPLAAHLAARAAGQAEDPDGATAAVPVDEYDPRDLPGLAARLRALPPGSVAVVSGHSNTTPELVALLGGPARAMGEDDHAPLWVVTLPAAGPPAVLELRY